ncbi:MFS transporter [Streptoalloteichus hindustanus]|uniref:Fucose permease n=1 Tax=Streptoalloteichus hindustanus TaxID=2017 RepID=A0A1M5P164_STRHI|nr:MFS transporter [Streptoalloteichus hindustanus]SHG95447.1 Fucose permease [Streptoalloteichus hindustanus]
MVGVRNEFRRAQLAVAALFCLLGFQYATWAARLPALKTGLDLSAAELGVLLLAPGVGATVSFPLVAMLMKRLGSRRLACLSGLGLGVVLLVLSVVPNYPAALVVMFLDGVAVCCLNVAMNAQGAAVEVRYERTTMAKLHATFSGGTFCAALLASAVTSAAPSLAVHFGAAAVVLVLLVAFAWPGLLTEDAPAPEKKRNGLALPSRTTVWLCLAMVFGTVTEGAMNDWSALYLKDVANASSELAPLGIAVVSAMMVLARLFADNWRARWGDRPVVLAGAALAAVGLSLALAIGGLVPALVGFACVGLGMAAVTPCLYVGAAKEGPHALTLVAAMGTTGLLAGPPVIGFVSEATTLAWGMAAVALSAALVALCVTRITLAPVADGEQERSVGAAS